MYDSIQPKYWVWGLIVAWSVVAGLALGPAVAVYVVAHLATTAVFIYGIWRAEQQARMRRPELLRHESEREARRPAA